MKLRMNFLLPISVHFRFSYYRVTILAETHIIYSNPCIKWGHNNETSQWKYIKEVVWFDLLATERKVYQPIL